MKSRWTSMAVAAGLLWPAASVSWAAPPDEEGKGAVSGEDYPVPRPPISEDYWPCSQCHEDMEVNLQRRELTEEHEDIKLHHGPRRRWCFDCHDPQDRDQLHLADGTRVSFKKSYILCGQCHGPKLRDWKEGIHGKRIGQWDGRKQYFLCVHCHSPHSPRFKPLAPKPPPLRPANIR